MKQVKIYFKSDFQMMLESETPWSDVPFRLNFFTNEATRGYEVAYDGDTWTNCHLQDDGRLCIAFDHHGLGVGKVMVEARFYLDNSCFNDGTCMRVVSPFAPIFRDEDGTCYELSLAREGDDLLKVVGTLPPFWHKIRYEDFTPEEIEALQKPARDAAEELREEDAKRSEAFDTKMAESDKATAAANLAAKTASASATLADEKAQAVEAAATRATSAAETATKTAADIADQFAQSQELRQQSYATAEQARQASFSESEKQRQTAFEDKEAQRDKDVATAVANANTATDKANTAASKADTATTNANTATAASKVQTDLAQELNEHPQKIGDNGNWWRWNAATKAYEDTGVIARGGAMYPTFSHEGNKLFMNDYGSNIQERVAKDGNSLILLI